MVTTVELRYLGVRGIVKKNCIIREFELSEFLLLIQVQLQVNEVWLFCKNMLNIVEKIVGNDSIWMSTMEIWKI